MERWWLRISAESIEGNEFERKIDLNYKLWIGVELYFDHGVAYFEVMNVVNWKMNEIIIEFFIFEVMKSNNIEIWSCIMQLKC